MQEKVTLNDLYNKRGNLKAILFDLDGTLIDSQDGIITILYEYSKSKGFPIEKESIVKSFGMPIEKLLKKLMPEKTKEEIFQYLEEIREIYAENHLQTSCTFPRVLSLLQSIKMKGLKVGIASTKFKKFVTEAVDYFGFRPFIDVVVSGYEVKKHKPAPDLLFLVCEQLEVKPEDCVYIGDSPSDIKAGKSAGMMTIAVLTGTSGLKKMQSTKPDFIVEEVGSIHVKNN